MEKQLLLLGILRAESMHGYQLVDFIDRYLASCTDLSKSTAYYLLNKMARDGWIEESDVQEGSRPPRRVYRLTEEGEATFQRFVRENLGNYLPIVFGGDIGLAFLDNLPREEALALLRERQAALALARQAVEEAPAHQGSLQLAVEHQRRHLRAEAEWLEEVLARLAAPALTE